MALTGNSGLIHLHLSSCLGSRLVCILSDLFLWPGNGVGYSLSSIGLEALSDEEISLLTRDHWSAIQNLDCLPALARSHGVLMRYTRVG